MSDTIAGRYTLIDPIARGGSGTVWRAWDQRRRHLCAAKVLRQRDSADLLRFVREQSVKIDHPHVLAPYGWAAEDEHVVIAMALCDGGTLDNALQDHGALSDAVIQEILRQLIAALQFVHSEGWIHRDVKPANLMLDATGTAVPLARLADFGIATQGEEARLTRLGTIVGTPGYIAPELMRGAEPDPSQDLFAAGVVAMRMVRPDVARGTTPTPEDAYAAFGEDSLLGAEVAALLDPDPQVRYDGAMSLQERLTAEPCALGSPRPATTRDGENLEIFQTLDPLPQAWQDIVDGLVEPPHQEHLGERIAQTGDAGSTRVGGPGPGPALEVPSGGWVRTSYGLVTPSPPGGEPLVGPAIGPAGSALRGMASGLLGDGTAAPGAAPSVVGTTTGEAVQGPLPEGQLSRAPLLGALQPAPQQHGPPQTGGLQTPEPRSISWSGAHTAPPAEAVPTPSGNLPTASQTWAPAEPEARIARPTGAQGPARTLPAAAGSSHGPLAGWGLPGRGGWIVLAVIGAVVLTAVILVGVLLGDGPQAQPSQEPSAPASQEPTTEPTTAAPTADADDTGQGGSINRQDPADSGLGGVGVGE